MASIAAFVYFWSSAYLVSGGCATDTLYPSFLRMLATASQPEPSAKAPCTRTTFLICCFTTILLCGKDLLGSVKTCWLLVDRCGGGSLFDELGCFLRVRHVGSVWIVPGLADDGPAVAVPNQNNRAAHGVDCSPRVLLVGGIRGFGGLRDRYRVTILLEDLGDGFPAGAIGECTVHQDHVLDASWRRRPGNSNRPLQQQNRA